jgi:competence protein ComEA
MAVGQENEPFNGTQTGDGRAEILLSWTSMNKLFSLTGIMMATVLIAAASLGSISAQNPAAKQDDAALPDGPGKQVLKKSCSQCHDASVITTKPGHTDDDWTDILNKMIGRGAVLSDDDGDTLLDYLSTNFGPSWKGKPLASQATAGTASGTAPGAAPGDGKPASGPETQAASSAGTSADSVAVNVNKASAQELQAALGISASEAELIVRHREQFGSYKTWEEVSAVPGVTAEKIKQNQKRLIF